MLEVLSSRACTVGSVYEHLLVHFISPYSIISKITEGGTLKQTVADRYVRKPHRRQRLTGNQIYLTDERWTHIVNTHPEMDSHRNNLLLTLQTGRRKQEPLDPSKYKYYKRFDILETGYNHIVVVVKFSEKVEKDTKDRISNNFVLTAYQTFIFSR